MTHRILVADDEELMCAYLEKVLSREPWEVETVADGGRALDLLCKKAFDVAVLDIWMPQYNGLEVLERMRQKGIQTDVVMLTGQGTIELAVEAMKSGAKDFLTKPIQPTKAVATIRHLLEQRRPSPHALARRLDMYVEERTCDPSLSLEDLCQEFRISGRYACRLFQEEMGTTFRRRLRYYRVQRAKEMLASTSMPMYQIAEACGFKNQRRFTETFRREEGRSPRRYRGEVYR